MFSTRLIAAAAASLSLMSSVTADYNPASQANLAMYYGQGPSQQSLAHFCNSSSVDIIPIGFINIFPNLANGLVAENFGNQSGYIACIKRLREHFAAYKLVNSCSKTYLISGAPQCPLPDGNMGLTIAGAQFDLLFIQFYNNGANGCTARNYTTDGNKGGFNYNKWVTVVNQGASKGAKLYLGLLGSSAAGTAGDYLTALESKSLIDAWHGAPQFGGVMLWEATYAENNFPSSFPGKNYYQIIKQLLSTYAPTTTAPATVCSSTVSSSKTSTSTSKTSSSTKISTTS
ncbi:glycoside hydrolase superfamily, partial [Leptodontidium sp. MPI-SDFR-AT-0119]